MTHLLNTNTCVDFLRRGQGTLLAARLAARPKGDVVLCSVVVAELLYGAERSNNPAKPRSQVEAFLIEYVSLPFDDAAAARYATVRHALTFSGRVIGPNDLLIASIALAHGLTVVTHNTGEFGRVPGLAVEDWQTP
jgi:tRNA(fMet)-specific endonuclease VapC